MAEKLRDRDRFLVIGRHLRGRIELLNEYDDLGEARRHVANLPHGLVSATGLRLWYVAHVVDRHVLPISDAAKSAPDAGADSVESLARRVRRLEQQAGLWS